MHTPNKGRGSVERIVQKLPINKDNMVETPSAPVRNIDQLIQHKHGTHPGHTTTTATNHYTDQPQHR